MDALDRVTPSAAPGDRLVVRYRLPDGSATDLVGWLERTTPEAVEIVDQHGVSTSVERELIVAARRVPAARGGRDPMRTSADELEQTALPGWLADSEPLGEWTLRSASGFTGRANSCLAVSSPGVPIVEAAARIVAYYTSLGLPPLVQLIEDSEPEQQLRAHGWRETYVRTDVLVARLAALLGDQRADPRVSLVEEPDDSWWRAYDLSRPNDADPAMLRRIVAGGHPRALADVRIGADVIAIGRGHVSADWLGLSSLWTAPAHRLQGWAGRVINTLGHWGARQGARQVYLQVAAENEAAHRAYARLGFVRHHGYRYLAPPE